MGPTQLGVWEAFTLPIVFYLAWQVIAIVIMALLSSSFLGSNIYNCTNILKAGNSFFLQSLHLYLLHVLVNEYIHSGSLPGCHGGFSGQLVERES